MPAQPDLTQVEKDKLAIDPDFDFREIAARPWSELTPNELAMFKWTGIYQQLQKGFFMMRLRLPGGLITADQTDCVAQLAETYGQDQLCITTRQTFQFHWLRKEDLYKVLEALWAVGLDTKNACGDVTRNVVTCALQGVCPHEVRDVRAMIRAVADDPELKDRQRNLPRKHKICIAGCGRACGQLLMNCEGWYPVRRAGEVGWCFHAGGGLGARPYMAKTIFRWVPEALVLDVIRATTELFRQLGNRRSRAMARLKIVVDQLGPAEFGRRVLELMRERNVQGLERIEAASDVEPIGPSCLEGQAVVPQVQPGFTTVRLLVPRSELTSAQARQMAQWARAYGDGTLMLTSRQNIQIRFVPEARAPELLAEIKAAGFAVEGFEHLPDMVACVGTTLCNLAVADTPVSYRRLYAEWTGDRALWQAVGPLRIHLNGCPNSCGQHWIADIGLRGMRRKTERGSEEGFQVCIGGGLEGPGYIAQPLCETPSTELPSTLRRLLQVYLDHRRDAGERFGHFVRRVGLERCRQLLGIVPTTPDPVNERNIRLRETFKQAGEAADV